MRCRNTRRKLVAFMLAALGSVAAQPHSASDAYLTLVVQSSTLPAAAGVVHAQWDIALRDLDFVLALDDDGDGKIRWGELRRHQQAIADYAFQNVRFSANGEPCRIAPKRQAVDYHADGAYVALFFDIVCSGVVERLSVDYGLFFAIDPSHRGIFVLHSGEKIATALLSPTNAKIDPAF
ncbi:MAG TPA: hypothetical protein VIH50_00655 [Steroidobacteraceae bacterium]